MHFLKQPKYTQASITCFLKHTYNHNYYAEKFLAFNFSHISTLLEYAKKSTLPKKYIYNILTLFNQKLSETYYVNNYAFIEFLEKLSPILKPYFNREKEKQEKILLIQKQLYELLTNNFQELKKNPEIVLKNTSEFIYNIFEADSNNQNNLDLTISDIKSELVLFLTNIISKLIWNWAEQKNTWQSVKIIAHYLTDLLDNQILNNDQIDKLFWYLITRFVYFISLYNESLNTDFYKEIYKDLENKNLFLYKTQERENYIKTKAQYFQENIAKSEIKTDILNKLNQ
jgi:hypothetical protein